MLWNCMCLFFCGKRLLFCWRGPWPQKRPWVDNCIILSHCAYIQCLVSLLSCKLTVLTRLRYSEYPYKIGVHIHSPEWHCLVSELACFYKSCHRLSDNSAESLHFLGWAYPFSYIVANIRFFLFYLLLVSKMVVQDNKITILTRLSVHFSRVKHIHIAVTRTKVQNFFVLWNWNSVSIKLPSPFAPQPLAPTFLLFCFYELDHSRYLILSGIILYLSFGLFYLA